MEDFGWDQGPVNDARTIDAPPIVDPDSVLRLVTEPSVSPEPKTVSHPAFLRAITREIEGSEEYRALTAGLVVLRLLDESSAQRSLPSQTALRDITMVRRTVEALPREEERRTLADVVNAIDACSVGNDDRRVSKTVSYAQLLERTARWDVAADTYRTVIALIADRPEDRGLLPLCYSRAGVSLRHIGQVDRAAELFHEGLAAAERLADVGWVLRLRMSLAKVESHKGKPLVAAQQLDGIIEDATRIELPTVLAMAHHDRGHVAYTQSQFELAAACFFKALKLYDARYQKQRAMHDLSTALTDLGYWSFARTVSSVLYSATAETSETRMLAGLNLFRIAILDNDTVAFRRLRKELIQDRMTGRDARTLPPTRRARTAESR